VGIEPTQRPEAPHTVLKTGGHTSNHPLPRRDLL
jgi:hypothetical protein